MSATKITLSLGLMAALSVTVRAQVELHEILADPTGPDDGAEIIELYNPGPGAVDLTRWAVFVDNAPTFGRHVYTFQSGRTLAAGAYLTIHWRAAGVGDVDDVFTESEGAWYDGGDEDIDSSHFGVSLFEDDNANWVGPDFSDFTKLRDFVQVGDDATARETIAANAGQWLENDVVIGRGEGISMVHDGTGNASMDWFGDVSGFVKGDNAIPTSPAYIYGSGCEGSGDYAPIIVEVDQIPADSTTRFQLSLINGLGPGAFLVVGYNQTNLSFGPDCTLWVTFDELLGPFTMTGGPGQGEGRVLLEATNPLPGSGFEVYMTFFCQDASEKKGFTTSNAVAIEF